jgi:ABC-2 type transport system permease protein
VFGFIMSLVPLLIGVVFFGSNVAYFWALVLGILLGNACISNLGTLVSTVGSETPQNVMLLLNLIRLPMMFISGIFIPINELPAWGRVISWFSPVSYVVDLLRRGLGFKDYFGPVTSSLMLVAFGLAMFALSVLRMKSWNK